MLLKLIIKLDLKLSTVEKINKLYNKFKKMEELK